MQRNHTVLLSVVIAMLACLGLGCSHPKTESAAQVTGLTTGPKPLAVAGLSPQELTKKINLTSGNILVMQQDFAGSPVIARDFGMGQKSNLRDVVIRSFAPGHSADLEWQLEFKDAAGKNVEQTGSLAGADLLKAYQMYLPSLWKQGDQTALGTGSLWLSSYVYENLTRSKLSTYDFGLLDKTILGYSTSSRTFSDATETLRAAVEKIIDHTDVYLTKTEGDDVDWPLKINGVDAKVRVFKAKNWFGEIVVLDNPQNPLVLKVTMQNRPEFGALNGFLDYEITGLKDIQG